MQNIQQEQDGDCHETSMPEEMKDEAHDVHDDVEKVAQDDEDYDQCENENAPLNNRTG